MAEISRRNFIGGAGLAAAGAFLAACSTGTAPQAGSAEQAAGSAQGSAAGAPADGPAFTQISFPIVVEIAKNTYTISEMGMDNVALIVGDERAVLLDTGTGILEWDPVIKSITDKPYDVYLTHGHVDHAGGMRQFDKIYMHEADVDGAREITADERRNYVKIMIAQSGTLYAMTEDSVIEWDNDPEIVTVKEGDTIDLGGRTLEIYDTPGHTPGSISFLDRTSGIMFTGDACNTNTLLVPGGGDWFVENQKTTVSTELETAKKLRDLRDSGAFNRNYNGHVGYAQWLNAFTSIYDGCIDDCITVCEGVLDGSIKGEEQPSFDGSTTNLVAKQGAMQIQYMDWQIA